MSLRTMEQERKKRAKLGKHALKIMLEVARISRPSLAADASAYVDWLEACEVELIRLAAIVGEERDPFAAWESIESIVDAHNKGS